MNEESLFAVALEKPDPAAREAFLAEACGGDVPLRQRLEQLLAAHGYARGVLDRGPDTDGPQPVPAPPTIAEGPGTVVGRYKLKEQIGAGGFGLVFVAEQTEPVRRKVALKVIKPGMDTREVVARFEAERQALALMDHPNIAQVFDAGATASGRPYFVMELVRGVAVTEYCDRDQLTTRERLGLFVTVCRAVQHAHHKGVIHRDLKPSNVLVTRTDGGPVVKVIDFGVAKALHQPLTDRSVYTGFAQLVGTPMYMSPEQAELTGLDIDTRADIYALGVLLYELLTGMTPFDRERFRAAGFDELRRLIREEDPPAPSTRVSTLGLAATTVSANRQSDPKRLSRALRGELDWVVMKCLEKDRNRRYETASALARDVERYLAGEPLEAGPPSAAYRLRKLAYKHRRPLGAAAAAALLLAAAGAVSTWQAVRATLAERDAAADRDRAVTAAERERLANEAAQRRLAQLERGNEFLEAVFRDLDPRHEQKEGQPLRQLLGGRLEEAANRLEGEAVGDPPAVARIQRTLGKALYGLGHSDQAIALLGKARATFTEHLGPDHPDTLRTLNALAQAYRAVGRVDEAVRLGAEALERARAGWGPDDPETLTFMHNLGSYYRSAGQPDRAAGLLQETLELRKARLGPDDTQTLLTMNNLGLAYQEARKPEQAIPLFEEVIQRGRAGQQDDHRAVLASLNNLAAAYKDTGRPDLALARSEEAARLVEAKFGPDHPDTLTTTNNLAIAYMGAGRADEALPLLRRAAAGVERRQFAHEHAGRIVGSLCTCLEQRKQYADAEAWRRKWLAVVRERAGAESVAYAAELTPLGSNLIRQQKWAEAETALREALAVRQAKLKDDWKAFNTQALLGTSLLGQRKYAEAEPALRAGYEGMSRREARIPATLRHRVTEALEDLIRLHDDWGKPAEAAKWRKELAARPK